MRNLIFVLALLFSLAAHAEIYQGIKPYSTLGDIKKKFPNAQMISVKAAWVTESEGFFLLKGTGLPGSTYLAFRDYRPSYTKRYNETKIAIANAQQIPVSSERDGDIAKLQAVEKIFYSLATQTDDEAYDIEWVRWVPDNPIPVARYIEKFGRPSKIGFKDDTMEPFNEWESRKMQATLSDDKKFVLAVEYLFTGKEIYKECMARFAASGSCEKP
jgi:hypothetical protein